MNVAKNLPGSQAMSQPFISRWSIPFAGLSLTLMGGISYAWGVFVIPLGERFGWSVAEAMLPLSVYLVAFTTVGMIYGGMLQDRYGPRKIAVTGGILFLLAYLMAAQIDSFPYVWWLILTYGVVGGTGCGLAYSVAIPAARKWFPDRPAIAMAVAVTGFGLAAVLFAPWITRLIRTVGIEGAFLTMGVVTFVITLLAAWVIRNPAPGWVPSDLNEGTATPSSTMFAARTESTLPQVLKMPLFYFLWLGFFGVIFGGLMAMAHVVPYAITILDMDRPAAALAAVFFGLANGFGRPIAGIIAQRVGPVKVMLGTYLITGISFLFFNTLATTPVTLYLFSFIFGWGFAVTMGLFPSLATISFGSKNLGAVYGAIMTAFGTAAVFGPMVAAWAYDMTGTYIMSFALAGAFSLVGWSICLFVYRLRYKLP